jgi:hypothetical protein
MKTAQEIAADLASKLRAWPENWCQGTYIADDGKARCLAGHLWSYFDGSVPLDVFNTFARACETTYLSDWNDEAGRTVEDVIAICDRVAAT